MISHRIVHAPRGGATGMTPRTVLLTAAFGSALAAGAALGDDPISRAQLERRQREDAFTLGVQQSMERARAGSLGASEQRALDARQREQRQQQDLLFYQQQIRTYTPVSPPFRHAETLRAEQERADQLSRFRFDATTAPKSPSSVLAPTGPVSPAIGTAPVPRAPVDPAAIAAMRGAEHAQPLPLATIQRVEHDADTLWRTALSGDWTTALGALDEVRRSVDALRSDRFEKQYLQNGGRAETLAAVRERLDATLASAETDLGARDAHALMRSANQLMLTAAELVPDITRTRPSPSTPRRAAR